MPLIQCSHCGSVFDVQLKTLGKNVKCARCKEVFRAATKMSGPRRKTKSQAPFWIGGTALVALTVFLAVQMNRDDGPATAATVPAESPSTREPATASPVVDPERSDDPVRRVVDSILHGIESGDDTDFLFNLSYPRIHNARVEQGIEHQLWEELSDLDRNLASERINAEYLGDDEQRRFLQQAKMSKFTVVEKSDRAVKLMVTHLSLLDDRTQQDRELELHRISDRWALVSLQSGPIVDPEAARLAAEAARQTRRPEGRNSRLYAPVETQEMLADTDATTAARIAELAAKLTDLTLTTGMSRARRELASIGKPAIPALLNVIVGREKLDSDDDKQIVNQAVQTLREITQEDFGFAPSGLAGSLAGEDLDANQMSLQRWFGWWRQHKDSWTGPSEKPLADEEEDGR